MAKQASDTQKYSPGKSSSIFYVPKPKTVSESNVTNQIKLEYTRCQETSKWLDRFHAQSDGDCLTLTLLLNLEESRFWWMKIPSL